MTDFAPRLPRRIAFGRGCRKDAAAHVLSFGRRVALVRSGSVAWADELARELGAAGASVQQIRSAGEPALPDLLAARAVLRDFGPDCVVAVGGGSALDLGKALAALLPVADDPLIHFEIVGEGRPLAADPLPFIAIPTTSGTGAEATKNAVILIPEHRRKVSLRDDRMLADLALVDPALTDGCPRSVTLASGLDALVQVIEPYLCSRANPLTDALCHQAIPLAIAALLRLMDAPDPATHPPARDDLARASLFGGIALANAGLGAVHGLAGVLGGRCGAAHGALCGRLLPAVLRENRAAMTRLGLDLGRFDQVQAWLAEALGVPPDHAVTALEARIDSWGLPRLGAMGFLPDSAAEIARESLGSSSMAANPVLLSEARLTDILLRAA